MGVGSFFLLAGWRGGVVLAVLLCRRMVFSDVVLVGKKMGDISAGARIGRTAGGHMPSPVPLMLASASGHKGLALFPSVNGL
jgi:hypothetical protein